MSQLPDFKDRIFIRQWLVLKPYRKIMPTDNYYLQLSNKVKMAAYGCQEALMLSLYLESEEIDLLWCFLTSYLEDLVSDTNLWNTFVKLHKALYQKPLPFFDLEDYYEGEVNWQDIAFLIWYYLNTMQKEKFILASSGFITTLAHAVFEVLDEAWEYAPENNALKPFYSLDDSEDIGFYESRVLMDQIFFNSYLFYPDTQLELKNEVEIIFEENKGERHLLSYLNERRDLMVHSLYSRLLAMRAKDWASAILPEGHRLAPKIKDMSHKVKGFFFYKGQDQQNIFLEHIASGKQFALTKKSFDSHQQLNNLDEIVYIGMVRWDNEWWFSGNFFSSEYDAELVVKERNSVESKMEVDFLDRQNKALYKVLEKQERAFKKFTNGSSLVFLESDKIERFLYDFFDYYNNSILKLKNKKHLESNLSRKIEYEVSSSFVDEFDNGLVFFNPKSGIEVAMDVNSAFPSKENPFFDEELSEQHIIDVIIAEGFSTELALHCVNEYKSRLPFFDSEKGKLILNNLDFLLRFGKGEYYFSYPSVTLVGDNKS
jgi:hypothetical protein